MCLWERAALNRRDDEKAAARSVPAERSWEQGERHQLHLIPAGKEEDTGTSRKLGIMGRELIIGGN